ncbi:response regulator transcription factor [Actinokineospora auranticolor]|uniref:Two-component system response regulator MprA n=1 Tax=Actinokineospora auranticolor TaxID=155976 RepID=A0A2S6H0S5_9PSEU|nr:response regulator transcription factor [Actinokineospora auranticolor]PPK71064.1 two-component system response regulator MprA [Actinokineospora auranticolor]
MRLLVVDDDPDVRESLRHSLEFEGYEVVTAAEGAQALRLVLTARRPDLAILDLMMPEVDGLETCRRLRAAGERMPVLMLTARDSLGDRVTGLDAGADDYLVKPFALEELLARVRALLKQNRGPARPPRAHECDDLRLDLDTREVSRSGRPIDLTPTEFDLLAVLLEASGRVLTRAHLQRAVWGRDPGTNNLDVYIGYLRRKTEVGGQSRLLHTVRGVGFILRTQP